MSTPRPQESATPEPEETACAESDNAPTDGVPASALTAPNGHANSPEDREARRVMRARFQQEFAPFIKAGTNELVAWPEPYTTIPAPRSVYEPKLPSLVATIHLYGPAARVNGIGGDQDDEDEEKQITMQAIKPTIFKCAKAGTLACPGKCTVGRLAHQQQIRRIAIAPQHIPKPQQSNFDYWRTKFWAPEAAPMVVIVVGMLSIGTYFSVKATSAYDVAWKPKSNPYPWLNVPTSAPHLEDTAPYSDPVFDRAYHGERVLQRKSFKTPRYPSAQEEQ